MRAIILYILLIVYNENYNIIYIINSVLLNSSVIVFIIVSSTYLNL